jgi:metal-responsive CopG/Arc/MetJ family transcriptional regulator
MITQELGIKERFTVSMPDVLDREIVRAIMSRDGANKSSAIRTALRDYGRRHFPHLFQHSSDTTHDPPT